MVAALRTATDATPLVAGKPEPLLFETAAKSASANRPLAVGDRLDTDIAGAVAAGIDSLVVLTGVATPKQLLNAVPAERATYLAADLTALTSRPEDLKIGPRPGWSVTGNGTVEGEGDPLDLLRVLCHVAWETGTTEVRPSGEAATAALAQLGLA